MVERPSGPSKTDPTPGPTATPRPADGTPATYSSVVFGAAANEADNLDTSTQSVPVGPGSKKVDCPPGTIPAGNGCAIVDCLSGQIYIDGECVDPPQCQPPAVAIGQACAMIDCVEGTELVGTDCVPVPCPQRQLRVNDLCVDIGLVDPNFGPTVGPGPVLPADSVLVVPPPVLTAN